MQIIDKELSNTGVVISVGCGVVTLQGFLLAYLVSYLRSAPTMQLKYL
jgi:hypothetical protein